MESVKFPSHGGLSVRSILTFALAAMVAAFLWITFSSSPALAVGEATWGGDSIIFENHGFTAVTDISDPTGTILPGSSVYRTPTKPTGTGSDASEKVFIIYFSPGVDPPTATAAQFAEFTYDNGTLSNPQNKQDITLTLKSQQTASSSCTVEGIGWILCPATTWLAKGMDGIFDILSGFIETKPPTLGDSANSMYVAWNVMRTIANIAFVIAFLIIIYSQLTSIGVSNYGLKKLIPRLIVAAVLVNISFYVAALAIDVSNILGYSIQDIFNSIRESTFRLTSDDLGSNLSGSWAQVASIMLAGGGLYAGAYYVAVAGGIYMLVPLLVMLLVTIMLVLVILAARQAIILILVILAPLAFVANLLPNTEKWFDKWKDLFMTMLIFFPAFSLVFGGSQLAGQLIIQNAGNNIITVLFGLAVQIAPLVITPLLFKFSGGLLGRIGQIANNPSKGVLDRSRNWGNSRAELAKKRSMGIDRKKANPWRLGAAVARRSDFDNRRVKDKTDMWAQAATNKYEETPGFSKIHDKKAVVDSNKERIHNEHAAHLDHLKTQQGTPLHQAAMRAQVSKDKLETQQQHLSGYYNTLRTVGGTDLNTSNNNLEAAKGNNEASEQNKAAYLNQQRTFRTTQLGAAAERLEAAKLNSESMQSTYTAHIDSLKIKPNTTLSVAAERLETSKLNAEGVRNAYTAHIDNLKLNPDSNITKAAILAQSSKEHAEGAQNRVQAMFDVERRTEGTSLNISTLDVEKAKFSAEASKSFTTEYLNNVKLDPKSDLHLEKIRVEQSKLAAQASETSLSRVVEEYKTGKIEREGELGGLMTSMVSSVARQAAEARGVQAAQNIQQKNVAEVFTSETPFSEELLKSAKSVDPQGEIRARAAATSQLNKIEKEALDNNMVLLEDQADAQGINILEYSKGIFHRQIGEYKNPLTNAKEPPQPQDPALLEAALEILAKDGDIGNVREALMNPHFGTDEDRSMINRVIARNSGTMKQKGGFDIQQKLGKLWNASQPEMDLSIAGSLGAVTAENISSQKWGWWHSLASVDSKDPQGRVALHRIIDNVNDMPESAEKTHAINMLRSFYGNLTSALSSQEIMNKIGDRKDDTAEMHELLQNVPGLIRDTQPIDYDKARAGLASGTNPRP